MITQMLLPWVVDIKGLPVALVCNQILAVSGFYAVHKISTTDVEPVTEGTTGLTPSWYIKVWTWAPFICVYGVN